MKIGLPRKPGNTLPRPQDYVTHKLLQHSNYWQYWNPAEIFIILHIIAIAINGNVRIICTLVFVITPTE